MRYFGYKDLVARGIVNNRTTLRRWIAAGLLRPPVKLGPNTNAWTEDDIQAYDDARRAERAARLAEHAAGAPVPGAEPTSDSPVAGKRSNPREVRALRAATKSPK